MWVTLGFLGLGDVRTPKSGSSEPMLAIVLFVNHFRLTCLLTMTIQPGQHFPAKEHARKVVDELLKDGHASFGQVGRLYSVTMHSKTDGTSTPFCCKARPS